MKKVVFIVICVISGISLTSCGSTTPCGLAKKANQIEQGSEQNIVAFADNTIE